MPAADGAASSRGWARVRRDGNEHPELFRSWKCGLVGKMRPRCVLGQSGMAAYARDASSGGWSIVTRACNALSADWQWQYSRAMRSQAAIRGNLFAPCIPEGASDGKITSSRQDSRAMYPKRAGFGKICAPCIRKAPQIAFQEYTARRSCQEGAPFAAQAPRIMHGAQIFPRFSVRKVLRAESKMNWVLQVHFALPPTVPPCDVTARLWQPPRLVGSRCGGAYVRPSCVRPQQPSPPPLFGNRVPWSCTPRPAAALAAGASRYPPPPPHGVVCPMAAACPMGILLLSSCPYPFGRQRFSSTQRTKKRPDERWSLWRFVALAVRELCADYSARSFRRRSSSSAS